MSPEATPIFEIVRRKIVLSTQQISLRKTLSNYANSYLSPIPITFNMTYVGSGSGTRDPSLLQPSTSLVIGSIYSHQVPIQSTTSPAKVIKKYRLF